MEDLVPACLSLMPESACLVTMKTPEKCSHFTTVVVSVR
jgi:hypothetical protein